MKNNPASENDPFKTMLMWSGALHLVLFVGFVVAAKASQTVPVQLQPGVAWIVPGSPGPGSGGGGGSPSPPEPPKPEPEPEPPPEPKKREPRVVRPTKEDREQLPLPDAKSKRRRRKEQTSSGLLGRDAASADSAKLKGTSGVPGLGLGGAGGGSAFDQDFEYSYYVQQMLSSINLHWQRVPVRGETVVIIRFTIFKDGHLEGVEVETSSGIAMLDRAAERAVYLSDPFSPLPNSYPRDRVGVHLQFVYSDQNRDG